MSDIRCSAVASALYPDATLVKAQRLTGGVSADVFRLDFADNEKTPSVVLRIHGETHSGHPAKLEFALLKALAASGIPVAEPLHCDDSVEVIEEHYLTMALIDGSTGVAPEFAKQAIESMARMLSDIHRVPTADLPKLPTRTQTYPEVLNYLPTGEEWGGLAELLEQKPMIYHGPLFFLHGDFWPENIMWRDQQIVGVLDWEDAALGDPLCDVASAMLELRYFYGEQGAQQFFDFYQTDHDIVEDRLAHWQIYTAAAAQKYMGQWGLPVAREAHMRETALQYIREAWEKLKT